MTRGVFACTVIACLLALLVVTAGCSEEADERGAPTVSAGSPPRTAHPGDLTNLPLEANGGFERIVIAPGGPVAPFVLLGGWSSPERTTTDGVETRWIWSQGASSSLRFVLDEPRPVRLELDVQPFGPDSLPQQTIEVVLNGSPVATLALERRMATLEAALPPNLLRAGANLVELRYAWSAAPSDLVPESNDRRVLAVRYEELRLLADRPGRPAPEAVTVAWSDGGDAEAGLRQSSDGSFSVLLWPPRGSVLDVATLPEQAPEGGFGDVEYRIDLEWDGGSRPLLTGRRVAVGRRSYRLPLETAGEPEGQGEVPTEESGALRLRFAVEGLQPGAGWVWIEPRVTTPGPAAPAETPVRLPSGSHVILVVLDAASRGRFGLYGYAGDTTPAIDALAAESLVFDAAFAQASYTLASTPSLLTSLLPSEHGLVDERDRLDPEATTLAEVLRGAGFATALVTGNPYLSAQWGLDRGFDDVIPLYLREGRKRIARADDFLAPAVDWLREQGEQPGFLYLHYIQPHEPYDAAPGRYYRGLDPSYHGPITGGQKQMKGVFRGETPVDEADVERIRALYDGNLRYADAAVGRLVEELRSAGLLDRSVLVVTSDHGESLGERGSFGHGRTVDAELISLPLLVRLPSALGLAGRVPTLVASIDVMPTLLALVGVPAPDGIRGRNILQAAGWPRVIPTISGDRTGVVSAVAPGVKYSFDPRVGRERLLPLPAQEDGADLRDQRPVTVAYLAAEARRATPRTVPSAEPVPVPESTRTALEALGYVERATP